MNDELVNNEIRRFLKKVGIQAHQAIERAIQECNATGKLADAEHFDAVMNLHIEGLGLDLSIHGDIAIQ